MLSAKVSLSKTSLMKSYTTRIGSSFFAPKLFRLVLRDEQRIFRFACGWFHHVITRVHAWLEELPRNCSSCDESIVFCDLRNISALVLCPLSITSRVSSRTRWTVVFCIFDIGLCRITSQTSQSNDVWWVRCTVSIANESCDCACTVLLLLAQHSNIWNDKLHTPLMCYMFLDVHQPEERKWISLAFLFNYHLFVRARLLL